MANSKTVPNCSSTSQLCGLRCISRHKNCRANVSKDAARALLVAAITQEGFDELSKLFDDFATPAAKAATEVLPYTKKRFLGKGQFGTAILTDRDTVVKTIKRYNVRRDSADLQQEYDGIKLLHSLGIGPKPLGLDLTKGLLEMEQVKGQTLKEKYGKTMLDEEGSNKVVRMMAKLHKAGYLHNDAHRGNIIETPDGSLKLIDTGFLTKSDKTGVFRNGPADLLDSYTAGGIKQQIYDKLNQSGAAKRFSADSDDYTYRNRTDLTTAEINSLKRQASQDYHAAYMKALDELDL